MTDNVKYRKDNESYVGFFKMQHGDWDAGSTCICTYTYAPKPGTQEKIIIFLTSKSPFYHFKMLKIKSWI